VFRVRPGQLTGARGFSTSTSFVAFKTFFGHSCYVRTRRVDVALVNLRRGLVLRCRWTHSGALSDHGYRQTVPLPCGRCLTLPCLCRLFVLATYHGFRVYRRVAGRLANGDLLGAASPAFTCLIAAFLLFWKGFQLLFSAFQHYLLPVFYACFSSVATRDCAFCVAAQRADAGLCAYCTLACLYSADEPRLPICLRWVDRARRRIVYGILVCLCLFYTDLLLFTGFCTGARRNEKRAARDGFCTQTPRTFLLARLVLVLFGWWFHCRHYYWRLFVPPRVR